MEKGDVDTLLRRASEHEHDNLVIIWGDHDGERWMVRVHKYQLGSVIAQMQDFALLDDHNDNHETMMSACVWCRSTPIEDEE